MNGRSKLLSWVLKMDTTPLPTQDSDISDSGSVATHDSALLSTYVVRITPCDKFTFQQVVDFLKGNESFYSYVVSRETVPREHFHIVIQTDISVDIEDVRGDIRFFILPFWTDSSGRAPKGFGNKQYNLQISNDLNAAVSYCVKLGEYEYEGFEEDYILERKAASFDKKKPCNFKSEYRDLSNKFQESDMDIREFMIEFCNLKAKYDQQINMAHVYGYALSNLFKRDKNSEEFVENYLYKQ